MENLLLREPCYKAIIEYLTDGVLILSATGVPIFVSSSVQNLLGYTKEEIHGMDLFSIAHPEDIKPLKLVFDKAMANPGVSIKGHTGRIRHKNGNWRWLEATLLNMLHDPAINGIIDQFRDVTEIKLAEAEATKKEDRFKALIENNTNGMAILSPDGKPIYVSPSIEHILGYTAAEVLELNLYEIIHPEDVSIMHDTMRKALAGAGVPVIGEATRVRHKRGHWIWIAGVVTNMIHHPSIKGLVDNFHDVTDKKIAEIKLIDSSRLIAFISQINKMILHTRDEQTVYREACRIALDVGNFEGAWISLSEKDSPEIVTAREDGLENNDFITITDASDYNSGLREYVLKTGTSYISNSWKNHPDLRQWQPVSGECNYYSRMILPIRKSSGVIGTFNVYSSEPDFFRTEQISVLEQAVEEISFALDMFETEKFRILAEEKVKESELSLKQAQGIAHVGSWELDYATGNAVWSDEQLKIFGLHPSEKEQSFTSWNSFIHPEDLNHVLNIINDTKSNVQHADYFYRILRKDGTVRHLYAQTGVKFNVEGIPAGLHGAVQDVTEIKQAEMALNAFESDMRAVFENTSDGIILTDINGIIKSFNTKSRDRLFLNTGQEISVGGSIFDYVHESRRREYRESINKVLSGKTVQYDHPFQRKNGDTRWFSFTINPVYTGGQINGMSITSADITDRKEAQYKLQESELFNRGVLAALSAHIAVVNDMGDIIAVNKAWDDFASENGAAILDRTSAGSNYFDVCKKAIAAGERYAAEVLDGVFSVFQNENKSFSIEYPCHSSTEERWFVINVGAFGNDRSKVVISYQNISEQKRTEAALRESESNLQAIFQNTSEGFILVDINGAIKSFNKKAKEIFLENSGKQFETGESIFNYVPESKREDYKNTIPIVASGKDLQYDIPFVRINGDVKWFIFSITRVIKNGVTEGFSITVQDITGRKEMEELVIRSQSNLNAIIENTDAFIYSLDTEFKYITFNSSLQHMMKLHYGITILPGYPVFDFIRKFDPDRVDEWNDVYSRALKGEIVHFDKEFVVESVYSFTSFSIHPIWEHHSVIGLSCFVNDRTKEKLAEKAVIRGEMRYRQIVETAQEGIWLVGKDNKTIFVNNKLCEILGYREDEFIGKDIYAFMDEEGMQLAVRSMENGKQRISGNAEFKYISKSGAEVWTNIFSNPVFNDAGVYEGALAMISDITEKRRLTKLLDVTNNMARIGSYEADFEKNTVYWSAMTREIHEVPKSFSPGIADLTAFYKEGPGRQGLIDAYKDVQESNIPFDLELEIVTAQGNERWVRLTGKGKFQKGICVSIYGSFQDVDNIKRAELEVLKAYEEKNVILESIADAFFATNKNWIVTYWNKEAERLLGQTKKNMLGHSLWDKFPETVGLNSYQQYHQAIETGFAVSFNDYYKHLKKWFEISAFPSAAGLSVYIKDITSRKLAETERSRILTEMTQRNKDLEQFSYIVSHNLRAPVANIMGLAEELNDGGHSTETKMIFKKELLSSVNRLDEVIADLNSILQTKREISERKEPVIFSVLVDNIKSSIRNLIDKEHVIINTDFTAVDRFTTIKSYLYSIFYNLISNSIKYRQPGVNPVIQITTRESQKELLIIFKDNGSGIDLVKKGDLVFGLYKRFHKDIEGKGMGLFMVKVQVETLGGKISIQSAVNHGTEFTISFEH